MDDLISRRAAIDALHMHLMYRMGTDSNKKRLDEWINNLPSAQPERKKSDWIYDTTDERLPETVIRSLSAVQPEQKWIPCSVRMPEYNESVLTWDGYVFCIEKRIPYIRDDDGEPIEGDWWVGDEYDEYESEYYPNLRDGAAIAWMPLPEPYRGGEK